MCARGGGAECRETLAVLGLITLDLDVSNAKRGRDVFHEKYVRRYGAVGARQGTKDGRGGDLRKCGCQWTSGSYVLRIAHALEYRKRE